MDINEKLAEMRARAASTKPVDWAAVRRASAVRTGRTEDEQDLVDAFAS